MLVQCLASAKKHSNSLILGGIIAASALVLNSCAQVQGLYVDPTFTYNSMLNGNIGIGGVASSSRHLSPATSNSYANLLRNAVVNQYPGMNIMPAGDAVRALGPNRYQNMLHYFGDYGTVQTQDLAMLHSHVKGMRYMTFAKISQDQISRNEDNSDSSDIVYRTTLTMTVQMMVYDLKQQRMVWSGSLTESSDAENNYNVPSAYAAPDAYGHVSMRRQYAQEALNAAASATVRSQANYPNPPSADNLLTRIFAGLAKKLPVPVKQK